MNRSTDENFSSGFEHRLMLLCGFIFTGLLALDLWQWHPGFSFFDEGVNVSYIQEWIEGRPLPLHIFTGCIHRFAVALAISAMGSTLYSFRLVAGLGLALETWLLYALAKRQFGSTVAAFAVLINLVSSLTFLRARSTLSYSIMPAEILIFEAVMSRTLKAPGSLLLGLGAALMLLDYEAWVAGLLVLGFLWGQKEKEHRPKGVWIGLGFFLGLVPLILASRESFADYLLMRTRSLPHNGFALWDSFVQFAHSFFISAPAIGYLGVTGHSYFPTWAIPALLVGIVLAWRRAKWLLGWAALGLLPALTIAAAAEPNRIMAAWPALCLVAALGLEQLMAFIGSTTLARWSLVFLILLGCLGEAAAYGMSMHDAWPQYYAESTAYLRLGVAFKGRPLVNELGDENAATWRFLWPRAQPGAAPVYVFPPEFSADLGKELALVKMEPVAEGLSPLAYVDHPSSALAARLDKVASDLGHVRRGLPRFDYRQHRFLLEQALDAATDPWTRASEMEEALRYSSSLGDLPPRLVKQAMTLPLASSSSLLWLADKAHTSGDDAFARRLCARALKIDPRRPCVY